MFENASSSVRSTVNQTSLKFIIIQPDVDICVNNYVNCASDTPHDGIDKSAPSSP